MHVLYVHQNFPAQFGHIAAHLVKRLGWRCTFVSEREPGLEDGIEKIQYTRRFGATGHNSYYTRGFETAVGHTEAVYRALKARKDIKPDLIVGHSGFGSTAMLPELYPDTPIVNFFEYFYRAHNSDMDFRPDTAISERKLLRSRVRNAMILLDLENCDVGYTPTAFQHSVFPRTHQPKIDVIFDGVETQVFRRQRDVPRKFKGRVISPDTRIVTYCSRGFEKMRGFDMFMKAAKIIYQRMPNVLFLVAGSDRICYGGDQEQIGEAGSFRHWVLTQDNYDLSKFLFLGWLAREELVRMISVGDAHIYLTVPFVLSWSMMNAMSCGACVIGSDTAPVREMITPGHNGFLANFFDAEEIAAKTLAVLRDPPAYEPIRQNAAGFIEQSYSLDIVLPRMVKLYEATIRAGRGGKVQLPAAVDVQPPIPIVTRTTPTRAAAQ
jgi:glycosyltransferase involved in cell wall biosynthesis